MPSMSSCARRQASRAISSPRKRTRARCSASTSSLRKAGSYSFRRQERHAHRLADTHFLAVRRELAGLPVDAEDEDVIRFLIGGEQPTATRIEAEIARRLATRQRVL